MKQTVASILHRMPVPNSSRFRDLQSADLCRVVRLFPNMVHGPDLSPLLNPPWMPFDRDIEIPDVLRPGFPASANARQSLESGLGVLTPARQNQPTTTIRLIANPFSNVDLSYGARKNGTPHMQSLKTTRVFDDDLKAGKHARKNSGGQLLVRFISNPFSNVDLSYGADENGTPQMQPFETTSVFCDARERVTMNSEGQLSDLEGEQKKYAQKICLEREQEAIRKKLEANRARRRSSAAYGRKKSGKISAGRPSLLGETVFSFLRVLVLTMLTFIIR